MSCDIALADILKWAAEYDGDPFHALITDPPYHLTEITKRFGGENAAPAQFGTDGAFNRLSKGFMGKQWDGGRVAFEPATWAALGRLLHPGAFGMAFASTRGFHRMAVAIEDAGFVIHPMICWNFACLSEDTEILTTNGWEPYHKAIAGTDVLCYNTASESLEWNAVQELYVYDYNDTAYRIRSDRTDQIVTPNHRCLVERSGKFVFRYAQTLERQEVVPILESMPDLWHAVQRGEQRPIPQSTSLPPGVLASGTQQCQEGQAIRQRQATPEDDRSRAQRRNNNLCVRQNQVDSRRVATEGQAAFLLSFVSCESGDSADIDRKQVRPNGHDIPWNRLNGRVQSGMEGRGDVFQETRQLYRREVHQMPRRVYQHGAQGWLCNGASDHGSSGYWTSAAALRSGTPQGSQSSQQSIEKPATVRQQQGSQAVRASWVPSPDLATVTPVHYRGKVWCVRVPTGAFVARRSGKIFITGNSGFPKATRIDVQIDRAAGAARETKDNGYNSKSRESFDVTAPATPLAQAWEGHRYGLQALKPAIEPIIVFQKPYAGRPVDSITRTGAGAINVDGGRIGSGEDRSTGGVSGSASVAVYDGGWGQGSLRPDGGRWPANLMLSHSPECNGTCHPACPVRRLGEQSGESTARSGDRGKVEIFDELYKRAPSWHGDSTVRGHDDSGTAARFFFNADYALERLEDADSLIYVPKASTAEREAGLIDFDLTTVDDGREKPIDGPYQRGKTSRRNIHPTIKPIALSRHLASLLLPPDLYAPRRLLIPFAGVASEMIGAMLAGWEDVQGIELEAEYVRIAQARIVFWQQMKYKLMNPDAPVKVSVSKAPAGQVDMFESEKA